MNISLKTRFAIVLLGLALATGGSLLYAASDTVVPYSATNTYASAGTHVVYSQATTGGYLVGVFKNGWYLSAGVTPQFYPTNNGWVQVGDTVKVVNLADATGTTVPAPSWNSAAAYGGGMIVTKGSTCYKAKWWTTEDPATSGSPWESVTCPAGVSAANPLNGQTVAQAVPPAPSGTSTPSNTTAAPANSSGSVSSAAPVAPASGAAPTAAIPVWSSAAVYLSGNVVQYGTPSVCYKAKWWTSGNQPKLSSELANEWDSPWAQLNGCPTTASLPANTTTGQTSSTANTDPAQEAAAQPPTPQPSTSAAAVATTGTVSIAIPPVVPTAPAVNPSTPVATAPPTQLPDTGYAFLRRVSNEDWDWLFPLRSGKLNANGGLRNSEPFAKADGSTDTFTLNAFIRAVLQYNNWAKTNGYKQFLNEGTQKQQAEEFLTFWAKSSRETSGSWSNAPTPWIVQETIAGEALSIWKGGLYWVEEVGYTTNSATGISPAINYVDSGSTDFPPSPGRSYYGRGVIQLSWNYNYGAFSYWMYDNGLFRTAADTAGKCKIDARNKLLDFPNLVADCGDLSFLSGIWFWMTPQGAKPSSHDVLYGDVTNISSSTQNRGLPQTNSGYVPKVASGSTTDEEVFAVRLGAIINIVNGGIECNKASKWHNGPPQRVSYYNAYAAHFNAKYNLGAVRVPEATNVWTTSVSENSPLNLQSATCYNQKSYYGW